MSGTRHYLFSRALLHQTLTLVHVCVCVLWSTDRLTEFFRFCKGCHFHFISFHIYDCNYPYFDAGSVAYWLDQVKSFGLPIWLTEFDCPGNAGHTVTIEDELKFMINVFNLLDHDPQVERYARVSRPRVVYA